MQDAHAEQGCNCSSGRGSAACSRKIPWVSGDAGQRAIAHTLPSKLWHRGFPEEDAARFFQSGDRRRIESGRCICRQERALPIGKPTPSNVVFDRRRHAIGGTKLLAAAPAKLRRLRGSQRALAIKNNEGVDLWLEPFDPLQARTQNLHGRQFARSDKPSIVKARTSMPIQP